ncbi:sugar transferase [Olleya sp. HaHaR_3_96]|uniref:sugar transferase n=1 Tax=Olleya sp. HaHaR_3_96 TaxID=2745560 RepID=UPI001C4E7F3E|nr:sugar transferase [Olleya sp. HaHaR_3_96]QXP60674.1 sugar transferase [Olleya sp. HaHaR_3_96]
MYKLFFKRIFDLIFSIVGLVVLFPFFIIVLILLAINNEGKPFFYQSRPGRNEKIFKIIKFKTMTDKKDDSGSLLPDVARLTALGRFVRKSSLDEIPQLLNVLKGDMSLIGPRPLLPEYLSLYTRDQSKRHNVKPGITGWAQVNGRNNIGWKRKFELDVWYVENISFILDIKILFKTVAKVLMSKDINTENEATTTKFTGK